MTDLAAELRDHLNAIAHAKAIHGQGPTDATCDRYETAKCWAADWLYGKGDELQAALRASRPEPAAVCNSSEPEVLQTTPAADAVEALAEIIARARRCHGEPPAVCRCFGACDCADEARKIISALPRPAVDEGAVAALKGLLLFFALPGETSIDRFERQAAAYYRETGRMAPGKDCPMGGPDMDPAERHALFDAWVQSKVSAALAVVQEGAGA